MSRLERRAPHQARLVFSLAFVMLCLAVSNRTHPDDVSAAVRFRTPHVVAGCATEFAITAVGLVQGVTYRLMVSLARGGDLVSADETSVAWSHEMAATCMDVHVFTHTLPPLSLGPHTLRVTLLDAAAGGGEDTELASMVQRLDPTEALAASAERDVARLQRFTTWMHNESRSWQDMFDYYREAVANVRRYDSYGFSAWAYQEKPTSLGIQAFVLCHIKTRCASAQRMLHLAGFHSVHVADTRVASDLDLKSLVSAGQLSTHFSKGSTPDQKLKYIANALDHRDLLRAALDDSADHRNESWVAIFEDDIILTASPCAAAQRIRGALQELPQEADTLHLEYCNERCTEARYSEHSRWVSSAVMPYCSAGIMYSMQGLRKLLNSLSQIVSAHDDHIAVSCLRKMLHCFKLRLPVFAQDRYWGSNISPHMAIDPFNRHGLRLNVRLCDREHSFSLIEEGLLERSSFRNQPPFELHVRQQRHPEGQLAAIVIKTTLFPHTLTVKVSWLSANSMYDFSLLVYEEDALMYTHHRVLIAGSAREGAQYEVEGNHLLFNVSLKRNLSDSTPRGHDGAASVWKGEVIGGGGATCRYVIHCMLVDTFPGLNLEDYEALVASARASTIHPCIRDETRAIVERENMRPPLSPVSPTSSAQASVSQSANSG